MKSVTTPASRRDQERLREAVAVLGEDVVHMIVDAVTQNSELPLLGLPDEWRDKAISSFRQIIRNRGGSHAA